MRMRTSGGESESVASVFYVTFSFAFLKPEVIMHAMTTQKKQSKCQHKHSSSLKKCLCFFSYMEVITGSF